MPAKSKAQQKFMGMVHGVQKGTINPSTVSAKVKKAAKGMKKKSATDYASTKHKGLPKKVTVKEVSKWLKSLEEFRYRKVRGIDARRVTSFVNRGMNEEDLPMSLRKKWEHRKYGREKHLANKYMTENGYDSIQKEGFGSEDTLDKKGIKEFEQWRKDNAEQLGYTLSGTPDIKEERDYKAEYKKFQSSTKAKKYRAELNQYNRKKGTYGNGDGKDASHKGGKIVGFESQSKNRGRAEKSRLKQEAVKFNIDKLLKNSKIKKLFSRLGLKTTSKDDIMKVLNHFARNPAALAAMKGLFGESINEATSSKDFFSGYKVTTMDQKKAIVIAKKMSGNMTGAVKKIEKIKKGLSDDSKVKAALRTANESVNEGGMGILSTDQADILQGLVMRNKNKNIKAILNIVLKSGYFKNVDKKELLGYIDGAKQFVKYMESHPMESIDESGILYRAGVKKYGKEGMRKIQQAAGKRKSHAEIGKIKDKYEKDKKESVTESDLGYTYKKGKTVKVKHTKSGKELVIVDKPAVRKKYEKLGFFAEGGKGSGKPKGNQSKQDSQSDIEAQDTYKKKNPKKFKKNYPAHQADMDESVNEARNTNTEWNTFEKEYGDFFKTVVKLGKANTKLTGDKTDEKIFLTNFTRNVGKFYTLMKSWKRGQNESVNEAVEPQGNMAKVAKIVKNKQATKLGGVMIDMQSANLLMKLWDAVSDKDQEKMNKMNAKLLTTIIKKLWSRINLKLPI